MSKALQQKRLTFSYDDGDIQDIRLIDILNKYDLKATFNLNSGLLGWDGTLSGGGQTVTHSKIDRRDVAAVYAGHEVAVHTLTHPNLTTLEDAEIIRQVEDDRLCLGELTGYEIIGMAYPSGGVNNDARVASVIASGTGVKYARTITSTASFAPQSDLLRFNPTAHHHRDDIGALARRFLEAEPAEGEVLLFYIWGHSYEFDFGDSWGAFDRFCASIAGRGDVFYGTNREVLL